MSALSMLRRGALVALALFSTAALAQEPVPPEASGDPVSVDAIAALSAQFDDAPVTITDARDALAATSLTTGLHLAGTDASGASLYVSRLDGRAVDYVGVDASGRVFGLQPTRTETDGGSDWACAVGDASVSCWRLLPTPTTEETPPVEMKDEAASEDDE